MGEASTCDADVPGMGLPRMVTRWMGDIPAAPGCGLCVREHSLRILTAHSHTELCSPPSWAQMAGPAGGRYKG